MFLLQVISALFKVELSGAALARLRAEVTSASGSGEFDNDVLFEVRRGACARARLVGCHARGGVPLLLWQQLRCDEWVLCHAPIVDAR